MSARTREKRRKRAERTARRARARLHALFAHWVREAERLGVAAYFPFGDPEASP